MDGCIYYIYILSTIWPGGGNPRGDIYICTIKLNERARFSPRSGNEVDTNVSFSICIIIRSCVQCVLAFCAFRACLMYIRCRPLQWTRCSRAAGGEGDRIGFEGILHFQFLTKRAITLYLIRVNISHLHRRALCIYCTALYTLTRVAVVVWNLLFFDGFLISRTGFIMRVTNIRKSIVPKGTRYTGE